MIDATIRFTCPSCRLELSAAQQHAGAVVQCPTCGQPMIVPVLQAADSGTAADSCCLAQPSASPSAEEALGAFFASQRKQEEEEEQANRKVRAEVTEAGRKVAMDGLVKHFSGFSNEQLVEAIAASAPKDSQLDELRRWWNHCYRDTGAPFFMGCQIAAIAVLGERGPSAAEAMSKVSEILSKQRAHPDVLAAADAAARQIAAEVDNIKEEKCPHGHGPLRLWNDKLRCWTCGWPVK